METHVYKITISPVLYEQMGFKTLTYLEKQEAIDALTDGFKKLGMTFTREDDEKRTAFLDKAGGVRLALVFPS